MSPGGEASMYTRRRFALRLGHFVRGYHIVDVNKLM